MTKKMMIFFLFTIVYIATLVVSCSDEIVTTMTRTQTIDTNLKGASALTVEQGYTDSLFMRMLALTGVAPELNRDNLEQETFLENTRERVQKYVLSWSKADGVSQYEIRASREPINDQNWSAAVVADYMVVKDSAGIITAQVPLSTAKVYSGKCINCGECVKACPFDAISTVNGKSVVDPDKCTRCGECWSSCKYDALDGVFAGTGYYFAIRSTNQDGDISAEMSVTTEPYELRYTTLASIPDSEKPAAWTVPVKGCYGNCGLTYTDNGECEKGSCYIVSPPNNVFDPESHETVCPVDAIYSVEDTLSDEMNTTAGAIFIDKDKCINCGRCVLQCQSDGWGSVTTEIVKSIKAFLGR